MNQLPTLPQFFIAHYYRPTLQELLPTGKGRSEVLIIALERFSQGQGFRIAMSERSLFRHLAAEAKGKR